MKTSLVFLAALAACARCVFAQDWGALDTLHPARDAFVANLNARYTLNESARAWVRVLEHCALIERGDGGVASIVFAADTATPKAPETSAPPDAPLRGLRVALEAGHVGGDCARIESRYFKIGDDAPVCEGDLTLRVARKAAEKLRALGADVWLVRENAAPLADPAAPRFAAEEIKCRATKINARKPDVLLSIHFDAAPWANPQKPALLERPTRAHFIVSGGYDAAELARPEDRLRLLRKLASDIAATEARLAAALARATASAGLPPPVSVSANAADYAGTPYLQARNLMVTRLYDCPTVLCELYLANGTADYARIRAGDYDGLRDFGGTLRKNVFEEYSDIIAEALTDFRQSRTAP